MGKLQHFARHGLVQTVNAGDPVTQRNNGPGLIDADLCAVIFDLLFKELCDFVCVDLSHTFFRQFSCFWFVLRPCLTGDQALSQAF
jgi:hypothetical protein